MEIVALDSDSQGADRTTSDASPDVATDLDASNAPNNDVAPDEPLDVRKQNVVKPGSDAGVQKQSEY